MKDLFPVGVPGTGRTFAHRPYQSRIMDAILAVDLAKDVDYTAGIMAKLARDGTVMIEHCFRLHRGSAKTFTIHGMSDMYDWPAIKPARGKLKRHCKAKPQPNCGPRGNNPW